MGIRLSDLSLSKSGNNLVLVTGAAAQITFKDWYLTTANRSVSTLQMMIETTADYLSGSNTHITNNKVEQFDFAGLVTRFDQLRSANSSLGSWSFTIAALTEFSNGGSDSAAIGGDLAHQYGTTGTFGSISMSPALLILGSGSFGTGAQLFPDPLGLIDLTPRLG